MHLSPTAMFILNVVLNTAIFLVLYIVVRKAIVHQTKARALKVLLNKLEEIHAEVQAEKDAKDPGEWGHYARIRNDKRIYAMEKLADLAKDISAS